jgi:hypothetical protein
MTIKKEATVREINGQLVLDDPIALSLIQFIDKKNCTNTFIQNIDRIIHFRQRLTERGMTPDQAVIVIFNVDDIHGGPLADILMPNFNWQEIRDKGQIPFARGLAMRDWTQEAISFDKEAATKLKKIKDDVAVVVVDYGVVEIFLASKALQQI